MFIRKGAFSIPAIVPKQYRRQCSHCGAVLYGVGRCIHCNGETIAAPERAATGEKAASDEDAAPIF